MEIVQWVAATVTLMSIVAFLFHIAGLFTQKSGFRPDTPVLNRFGEKIGEQKNPGYQETENEKH